MLFRSLEAVCFRRGRERVQPRILVQPLVVSKVYLCTSDQCSNQTGIDTAWSREYDYAQTYHEAQFSPTTVKELIAGFESDRGAKADASKGYIRNYYVGDRSPELEPFWSQYICVLGNHTAKAFAACVCSAGK